MWKLDLWGNRDITAAGVAAFAESPHLSPDTPISLDGNRAPKKAQRDLRKRFRGRLEFAS